MLPLSREISRGLLRTVGILSLLAVGAFLLYQIRSVFIYLLLAIILTLIGNPIVCFLKDRCKLSKTLAVSLTLVLYLLLLMGFLAMFYPLILTQAENLSQEGLKHVENDINQLMADIQRGFASFGVDINLSQLNPMAHLINEDTLGTIINGFFSFVGEFSIGLGATFFITFFFLKDKSVFIYQFKKYILPDDHTDRIMDTLLKIEQLLSRYFLGLSVQLVIFGTICYIVLLLVGVKSALVIALLSAILNIVPYIGPLVANVLASLSALLTFMGDDFTGEALPKAITVSVLYILIQFVDNNFLHPYIFSSSVKSHPLEIFLVILIFGLLGGIFSMVIAVPLYTSCKVIVKELLPDNRVVQLFTKNI